MFKEISEKIKDTSINLTISQKDDAMTVIILPKGVLQPLVMTGTPEEIDEAFVLALVSLGKVVGIANNLIEFEEAAQKELDDKKAKKAAKEKEAAEKKATKTDAPIATAKEVKEYEKKPAELIKDAVAKGDAAFVAKDYTLAVSCFNEALLLKPGDKQITFKLNNAQRWETASKNLFDEKKEEIVETPNELAHAANTETDGVEEGQEDNFEVLETTDEDDFSIIKPQ